MRNSSLTTGELDELIESELSDQWFYLSVEQIWLRSTVADNPKKVLAILRRKDFLNEIKIRNKNFQSFLFYVIFSYYHNVEEYRYLMRLTLIEQLRKNPEFFWLEAVLSNKALFLEWLVSTDLISYRSFKGLISNKELIRELQTSIVFCYRSSVSPKRVQRPRGYRDKGTLPDSCLTARKTEERKDWTLRELQLSIEEERKLLHDTVSLLEGLLM
jgi:hypothetical protein